MLQKHSAQHGRLDQLIRRDNLDRAGACHRVLCHERRTTCQVFLLLTHASHKAFTITHRRHPNGLLMPRKHSFTIAQMEVLIGVPTCDVPNNQPISPAYPPVPLTVAQARALARARIRARVQEALVRIRGQPQLWEEDFEFD